MEENESCIMGAVMDNSNMYSLAKKVAEQRMNASVGSHTENAKIMKDADAAVERLREGIEYRRMYHTPIVNKGKIGRNDPCPCGSGKKYKHCCGK